MDKYEKQHDKINYLEFPSTDLTVTKCFYSAVFGWSFEDFGPEYTAIHGAGIDGGFYYTTLSATTNKGSVLVVLYSDVLEQTQEIIEQAGG